MSKKSPNAHRHLRAVDSTPSNFLITSCLAIEFGSLNNGILAAVEQSEE
jgi:hypothetical protein